MLNAFSSFVMSSDPDIEPNFVQRMCDDILSRLDKQKHTDDKEDGWSWDDQCSGLSGLQEHVFFEKASPYIEHKIALYNSFLQDITNNKAPTRECVMKSFPSRPGKSQLGLFQAIWHHFDFRPSIRTWSVALF